MAQSKGGAARPKKPLKLPAAGFGRSDAVVDTSRDTITRGRSLAAIRWTARRVSGQGVSVNVGEGFLPHFAGAFLEQYGGRSEFVRAVSDLFTLALAQVLETRGRLQDPSAVALFSDERALASLRELVAAAEQIKQPLLQEALGTVPIGTVPSLAQENLGQGVFAAWLQSFEARDFDTCRRLLQGRS